MHINCTFDVFINHKRNLMRYEQVSDNVSGEENGSLATSLASDQLQKEAHTPLVDPSIALYETDDNINLALLGMKQKQERI